MLETPMEYQETAEAETHTIVEPMITLPSKPKRKFLSKTWQKVLFVVLIVLLFLASIGAVLGFYTLAVVQELKGEAADVQTTGKGAYDQFKNQNLPATQEGIKSVAEKMSKVRQTYNKL